ncbi:MAG: hypothetical protein RRY69_07510 [Oscillospiraceae bacterium]
MLDTIAAIATPDGEGGIGIVRISGERAHEIADMVYTVMILAKRMQSSN